MRGHRLARPHRTGFTGGVVANGEHEIERRRAGLGEFAPRLRAETRDVEAEALQQLERLRMHAAFRLAAGAEGLEFSGAELV